MVLVVIFSFYTYKNSPVAVNEASLHTFKSQLCGFAMIIIPLVLGSVGVAVPGAIRAGSLMVFSLPRLTDPHERLLHVGQRPPELDTHPSHWVRHRRQSQ